MRTAYDGSPRGARAAGAAIEAGDILGLNDRPGRLEERRAGDDHDIEARRVLGPAEDLTEEPLRPVALDGAPEFARGSNAEPRDVAVPGQDEDGHEPAPLARPLVVDLLEVCAPANVLGRANPLVHDVPRLRRC